MTHPSPHRFFRGRRSTIENSAEKKLVFLLYSFTGSAGQNKVLASSSTNSSTSTNTAVVVQITCDGAAFKFICLGGPTSFPRASRLQCASRFHHTTSQPGGAADRSAATSSWSMWAPVITTLVREAILEVASARSAIACGPR